MVDLAEPIAVVGIGCRFPGDAHDLDGLWRLLIEGRQAWSEVPPSRFNGEAFFHPTRGANAAHTHRGAHFLDQDIAAFDASFFGISATEATAVDPQQRLLLEVAYEALENAGITTDGARGSNTGVYIATFTHDYENIMYKDAAAFPKYSMTGTGVSIASNRISYVFDLKGPSFTLDTGCSGGLVALHQACQSLRVGETEMALAGGTNLILSPDTMMPMDLLHLLNPQGQCFPFDERGSGYGRGEGVAMVALKRLRDAVQAGDNIHAVIRGSGVSQDGKTAGITLPSATAQRDLINSTYRTAKLDPLHTQYVEAHGTGTIKGDLAELQALTSVFNKGRKPGDVLYVDSIKANIGHTEATSGLAGLIKAILMLQTGVIPPNSKLKTIRENLRYLTSNIKIPREPTSWPSRQIRRASINSFGYGGTNAHVIIEQYDQSLADLYSPKNTQKNLQWRQSSSEETTKALNKQQSLIITLSAKSPSSLHKYASELQTWLAQHDHSDLPNLAYTLNERRSRMRYRCALQVDTVASLSNSLSPDSLKCSRASRKQSVIFVFTGQGAQWYGMARELLERSATFKASIQQSNELLLRIGASWNLVEELLKDDTSSRVHDPTFAQPMTTAIQIATVDLLHSLDVKPNHVIGHSSGEIAAAYAAGALTQEAALSVAYHRGSLAALAAEKLASEGAMLAVALSEKEVASYLTRVKSGLVTVACANSPNSSTISGDAEAIEELQDILQRFAISARKLRINTAYHSKHMEAVAEEYGATIRGIAASSTNEAVQFHSTVTAELKNTDFGPDYWVLNLVSKVRFSETIESICKDLARSDGDAPGATFNSFVEIGPHTTLSLPIKQTISHMEMNDFQFGCISTLTRERDAELTLLKSLSTLYEWGLSFKLGAANNLQNLEQAGKIIPNLPHYAWDHSNRFWYEPRVSKQHRFRSHPYHDLLGVRSPYDHILEPTWRHFISVDTLPWIRDHQVQNRLIFPGAGYLAMAIEAKLQITGDRHGPVNIGSLVLKDVVFARMLELPDNSDAVEVHISLRAPLHRKDDAPESEEEFRITSIGSSGSVIEHCHGRIRSVILDTDECKSGLTAKRPLHSSDAMIRCEKEEQLLCNLDTKILYTDLEDMGHLWGETFALIDQISMSPRTAKGVVRIPDVAAYMPGNVSQPHLIHPTTLDALIHSTLMIFARACDKKTMFPVSIDELRISTGINSQPGGKITFESSLVPEDKYAGFDISAYTSSRDQLCLEMKGGRLRSSADDTRDETSLILQVPCSSLEYVQDVEMDPGSSLKKHAYDVGSEQWASDRVRLLDQAVLYYAHDYMRKYKQLAEDKKHSNYIQWLRKLPEPERLNGSIATLFNDSDRSAFKSLGAEKEALCRLGEALPQILTGESDPLSLLLQDDLLGRVYSEDKSAMRCSNELANYVRHLSLKNPHLKILEIGAGTGGATLPLLEALSENDRVSLDSYDFTDVSSGFFDGAREKLKDWSRFLKYRTLDIAVDPTKQGFEAKDYDIVIAYNALHVTDNIDTAIYNARSLLKSGGKLILIEITRLPLYVNAIFGLMPGWHLERVDGRSTIPTMSVDEWRQRLARGSFGSIDYCRPDFEGEGHQMSLMVATAVSSNQPVDVNAVLLSLDVKEHDLSRWSSTQISSINLKTSVCSLDSCSLGTNTTQDKQIYIICDGPMRSDALEKFLTQSLASDTPMIFIRDCWSDTMAAKIFDKWQSHTQKVVSIILTGDHARNWSTLSALAPKVISEVFLSQDNGRSLESRYYLVDGKLTVPRLVPQAEMTSSVGQNTAPGLISNTAKATPVTTSNAPSREISNKEVLVKVSAYGRSEESAHYELSNPVSDFSGVVVAAGSAAYQKVGDHVYGWTGDQESDKIAMDTERVCILPELLSKSADLTSLRPYLVAYRALVEVGGLQKGYHVLIRDVATPLGEAFIEICRWAGAIPILTAAIQEQVSELETLYPHPCLVLPAGEEYSSRVLSITGAAGAAIAIDNSHEDVSDEFLEATTEFGKYIRISETRDLTPLSRFSERSIFFTTVSWASLLRRNSERAIRALQLICTLIQQRRLKQLHAPQANTPNDSREAEASIKRADHPDEPSLLQDHLNTYGPNNKRISTKVLRPDATYIVAGDHEGLGLDICNYAISRGAVHIILLSTSAKKLHKSIFASGAGNSYQNIVALSCHQASSEAYQNQLASMPPVRGIFVANLSSNWKDSRTLLQALSEFPLRSREVANKIVGFSSQKQDIDFSIVVHTYGIQDGLRNAPLFTGTPMEQGPDVARGATIMIPALKDFSLAHQDPRSVDDLKVGGVDPVRKSQWYHVTDNTLRDVSSTQKWIDVVVGLTEKSLANSDDPSLLSLSILTQLQQNHGNEQVSNITQPQEQAEKNIEDAADTAEAESIIAHNLKGKISSLVAVEQDMVDSSTPVEDFGLDSLILFNFRSWIFKSFKADLKTGEISDASSVPSLAALILSRSPHAQRLRKASSPTLQGILPRHLAAETVRTGTPLSVASFESVAVIPRQPLPELPATLDAFFEGITPLCTKEELEQTTRAIAAFQASGSIGQKLQARLMERYRSPRMANWLTDMYTTNRFLRVRAGIVPFQTYFGTHPNGSRQHSQSQRAALLCVAAFKFKLRHETGKLEPQYLSSELVDPVSSHYLFHSNRVPCAEEDVLTKFRSNDHITVLCRGHAYKVRLQRNANMIQLTRLISIFDAILGARTQAVPFVGSLTATNRAQWAEARKQVMRTSTTNQQTIDAIETSAFVVCLDDAAPVTSVQRFRQFLSRADTNRWYDKSLQFVVCANGSSASVMEHAALDGLAVEPLHEALNEAIRAYVPSAATEGSEETGDGFEALALEVNEAITASIGTFCSDFQAASEHHTFAVLNDVVLGISRVGSHRWPMQSTIQLVIQLASRRHFGYSPFSMETVSMAHYQQGRVEVNPIIRPCMSRFLEAASASAEPVAKSGAQYEQLRALAYEATREHAKYLARASKGRAFGRHLLAMEWVRKPEEEMPALFTDAGYLRSKAAKVLTSSFTTGWLEGGFVYPVPGGVLVYFEAREHGVSYSIFGNAVSADAFREQLAKASEDVGSFFQATRKAD